MGQEMHLKGMEKVREKLPGYSGKRLALLPLLALGTALLTLAFLISLDILPRLLVQLPFLALIEPLLPICGMTLCLAIALRLIWGVWWKRSELKAEFGELAYQRIIPRGISGIGMVFGSVFHAFMSVRSLPLGPPMNELTVLFSQSLLHLVGIPVEIDIPLRVILAGFFLLLALMTVQRAFLTFGVDYMIVIYLYFPDESEIQKREIYSILRHPTYFAGVLLGIAAMFFRMSIYSIIFFVLIYLTFRAQISVEEKELVERFGDGYSEYMKKVPGLRVRPRDFAAYARFLLGRSG
ncbi:MAG: methyltransferase family protein, partial [Promethearchaeota archaeon]